MAAPKTYVHMKKFGVKAIGKRLKAVTGDAVKKVAIVAMGKATQKAVDKSSLLTTKPPKEKSGKALYAGGSLVAIEMIEKDGQSVLKCKVAMDAGDWDLKAKNGKMNLFPTGKGNVVVDKPDDAGRVIKDVAWLLRTVVGELVTKQLVKQLEIKAKALAKARK